MDTYIIGKNIQFLLEDAKCPGIELRKCSFEETELEHMSCRIEEKMHFIYVKKGVAVCQVNQEYITVNRGEGLFINKNMLHRLVKGEDCELNIVSLSTETMVGEAVLGGFVCQLAENAELLYCKLDRKHEKQHKILELMEEIVDLAEEKEVCYPLEIKSRVYQIVAALYLEVEKVQPKRKKTEQREAEKLQGMVVFLHKNYKNKITLGEIAENSGISTGDLCRFFKKRMGQTPFEYLQAYRIEKSIPELLEKADRITEVALRHGFHGSSYYAETFRKEMGCTPGEYRKWYLGSETLKCPLKQAEHAVRVEQKPKRKQETMPAHLL